MFHKRLLSAALAAALLLAALPPEADAATPTKESPLAAYIDESAINPAYLDWLEEGGEGTMPPAQDFSYLSESYANLAGTASMLTSRGALPAQFDLREQGLVDPVSDQRDLGVCWTIAANSAAAGSIRDQFPQLALSPIHTAWFCYHGNEEEEFAPVSGLHPYVGGGNDGRAVGTMAAWKGPVTYDKAPMLPNQQPALSEDLRYTADFHLQDAYYMPHGIYNNYNQNTQVDRDIVKQLLMSEGPVSTNYYAHGTNTYNPNTYAVYNNSKRPSDHAVLIVGWDDTFSKENFVSGNQPAHDGAWLVRNSWGTDWGDDGYFWLSYEDKTISGGNAYLLEEADNYAHNYQYDITGWSYSISTNSETPTTATGANIFTAESDEQLEAVSFYTTDAGTSYDIAIYTNVDKDQPTSGKKMLSQSGRETYAGYHTITLDEAVALGKGERFSIVVTFHNPSYAQPLAIEWCPMSNANDVPVYMGNGGESYALVDGKWRDVAGHVDNNYYITNLCIKGFTNPLPKSGAAVPQVQFSAMEGPVAEGTQLSLTAAADADIYVDTGNGYELYSAPIMLDTLDNAGDSITVRAYAEIDGKRGNVTEKTYTRASAQLTDLALRYGDTNQHLDTTDTTQHITLPQEAESVRIMAQSSDAITIDGQPLASADWTDAISVPAESSTTVSISVQGEGKTPSTTTLTLSRATGADPGPDDSPLYPVQLAAKPEHGGLLFSPTHAAAGTKVTITVLPDDGYTLDSLLAIADAGRKLEIRALGNSRYSFTMPESAVTLQAGFVVTTADTLPFDDVFPSDWFADPVRYVYETGLMVGTTDDLFAPQENVTRAMIWAVLARDADATTSDGPEWYSGAQTWAIENGISDGLRPNDSVSRQELITMFHRYQGSPAANADLSAYTDSDTISPWAEDAMRWGIETGLITGLTDTTLAPASGATRAQLATILMRFDQLG